MILLKSSKAFPSLRKYIVASMHMFFKSQPLRIFQSKAIKVKALTENWERTMILRLLPPIQKSEYESQNAQNKPLPQLPRAKGSQISQQDIDFYFTSQRTIIENALKIFFLQLTQIQKLNFNFSGQTQELLYQELQQNMQRMLHLKFKNQSLQHLPQRVSSQILAQYGVMSQRIKSFIISLHPERQVNVTNKSLRISERINSLIDKDQGIHEEVKKYFKRLYSLNGVSGFSAYVSGHQRYRDSEPSLNPSHQALGVKYIPSKITCSIFYSIVRQDMQLMIYGFKHLGKSMSFLQYAMLVNCQCHSGCVLISDFKVLKNKQLLIERIFLGSWWLLSKKSLQKLYSLYVQINRQGSIYDELFHIWRIAFDGKRTARQFRVIIDQISFVVEQFIELKNQKKDPLKNEDVHYFWGLVQLCLQKGIKLSLGASNSFEKRFLKGLIHPNWQVYQQCSLNTKFSQFEVKQLLMYWCKYTYEKLIVQISQAQKQEISVQSKLSEEAQSKKRKITLAKLTQRFQKIQYLINNWLFHQNRVQEYFPHLSIEDIKNVAKQLIISSEIQIDQYKIPKESKISKNHRQKSIKLAQSIWKFINIQKARGTSKYITEWIQKSSENTNETILKQLYVLALLRNRELESNVTWNQKYASVVFPYFLCQRSFCLHQRFEDIRDLVLDMHEQNLKKRDLWMNTLISPLYYARKKNEVGKDLLAVLLECGLIASMRKQYSQLTSILRHSLLNLPQSDPSLDDQTKNTHIIKIILPKPVLLEDNNADKYFQMLRSYQIEELKKLRLKAIEEKYCIFKAIQFYFSNHYYQAQLDCTYIRFHINSEELKKASDNVEKLLEKSQFQIVFIQIGLDKTQKKGISQFFQAYEKKYSQSLLKEHNKQKLKSVKPYNKNKPLTMKSVIFTNYELAQKISEYQQYLIKLDQTPNLFREKDKILIDYTELDDRQRGGLFTMIKNDYFQIEYKKWKR